ncbi:S8 family serine peptidase [Modestobacter sp. I12A-02628]|uniref:S8 family serine peptidase n=1 Tax=Goekera deserti TaxID=2497753 RepID=A0A7K3WH77_9ACTN|nr:S8 family serine peptidase [Goekera deserti]MPQ97324.1 S8 family serine peptidase [Goekera deserti]NDI50164.1 S8 family serine peptidase [Goekera deserti]NEL55732.1 S8 family serine peptidase [Goekera deserti]
MVAVAAALTATGGTGTALASPDSVAQRVAGQDGITLTAAQRAQVQQQIAARRTEGRPAGLPDSGPASFFIQLDAPASAQVYTDALAQSGTAGAAVAAGDAQAAADDAAARLVAQLPAAAPDASVLYTTSTVMSGVAVTADVSDYEALSTLGGVTAVHAITPKKASNTGAAGVVQAVQAWQDLGNTGEGVSIGIIDTGIDYTHTDFGGSGDTAQFAAIQAAETQPAPAGVFPSAKVVGGYDFVGDSYDADPTSPAYQPIAQPDVNPLDCNGHGTHVAGTAAGFGVNADGSTYTGGYGSGFDPAALKIGPGMAPAADLYALKVFGCEGSTDVTIQAIDWALDPNGDGDISDHLDVVNLSLGSDYGLADDADAMAAEAASAAGMLVVMSAGNAGDSYDIGGSPGNAPRGIGVAATNDGYGVFDGWQVTAPAGLVDGVRPGLRSVAYPDTDEAGAVRPDLTGDLLAAPAGNEDACAPLPAGYATGRVLLIQAAGFACGSVAKGTNATDAGAIGFVIAADDDLLETGITGVPTIPGILVPATDGAALTTAVTAGQTVTVTFGPSLKDAGVDVSPEQVDLAASFTSRGTRQEDGVKPDLAAPGVTLFSAAVGSGSAGISESGTSMAAPTTAGVTALVRAAHPDWTVEEVKADLMNTAGHDVYTEEGQSGDVYGPNRVGAGRIDAVDALQNEVLAYAEAGSGVVSASFGVVEVAQEQVQAVKTITVDNKGSSAAVYRVAYQALAEQPGVQYSLSAQRITVPPGQSREVTVTMTATKDQLRKVGDPTLVTGDGRQFLGEASGRVVLDPVNGKGSQLRVPVHANAKPASTLTSSASEDGSTITLTGDGVANGEAYQPTSYTSFVNGFEQLGTSPQLEKCTTELRTDCYKSELERSVDLATVGVASDVAAYGDDPGLYFAVSSHGISTSPETVVNYGVFIDADGDGVWDYQVTTTRIADYDLPLVVVTDRDLNLLPSNDAPYTGALNLVDGEVDTNTFDSDVQLLGVPLSAMPLVTGRISFGVEAISGVYGTIDDIGTAIGETGLPELTTPMSFDPLAPGLTFTDEGGNPALLTPATDGTTLTVTQDAAAYAADVAVGGPKGAMVVLAHNDAATGRTQSLPIVGATGQPAPPVTEAPVADAPAADAPVVDAPVVEAPAGDVTAPVVPAGGEPTG